MSTADFSTIELRYTEATDADAKQVALIAYDTAFTNAVEEVAAAEEDVANLEAEVEALEAELAALETANDAAESALESNVKSAKAPAQSVSGADYFKFLTTRGTVIGDFQVLDAALRGVAEGEAAKVVGEWAVAKLLSEELWHDERANMQKRADDLTALRAAVPSDVDSSLDAVTGLLMSIDSLRPKASEASSAFFDQQQRSEATREEMEAERIGLLTWCRQQKTNLDAMVEPDHAQEFCSSMLANFASMDKNFQVLLDFTYQLPGDEVLQRNMLECNEVWLNLQVSAYERMRHALLEVHPKSKLEDEVREFITFTEEVQGFVQQVRELFSSTNDPESDRFVRPVLDDADSLLSEYGMHEGLPKQLQDFCNRMDCLRDSYSNLRRAVLSRLTFLTSSVPALTASMRRKEEYVARMKDLKAWVEVKSQGETWGDIHDRILSIKALIEKERASLNEARAE